MPAYKSPTFQERTAAAATARSRALSLLRAKPQADPASIAAAIAKRSAREAAEADKRVQTLAAREAASAVKKANRAEASRAANLPAAAVLSDADRKAARDARYAARKSRKLVR